MGRRLHPLQAAEEFLVSGQVARRGRFITFEGGEGSGKSTQGRMLAARLEAAGIACRLTREPGGSAGAEAVRRLLLEERQPFHPLAESLLFAAARADHVKTLIEPALAAGDWVICDRFIDSTRAYQGAGRTVDKAVIEQLETLAIGTCRPDLTVILDLDPRIGLARAGARRGEAGPADRFEGEALAFHQRIRAAFRAIAAAEPARCLLIDATEAKADVAERIVMRASATFGIALDRGETA
jgi:dTMP kinase